MDWLGSDLRYACRQLARAPGFALLAAGMLALGIGAFLVDVSPSDPTTLPSVAGLLTAVALVASGLPTRRAASVDPVRALRSE